MKTVALGEISRFIRGITFKPDDVVPLGTDGSVACMRTKNVQTDLDLSDVIAVPSRFVKKDDQLLRNGDIVVSSANSWNLVGKCSWVNELPWPSTLGGFISAIRVNAHVAFPRYVYHWFSFGKTQDLVRSCARQTTNIANLIFDQCLQINLPLPPLEEQKRIAAILDQADDLRRKRQHALTRLNQLGQAIFYEMFGDPVTNPMGWPIKKLGEIGDLDRGISKHRPRNDPALLGGKHPLIQTGDVANADRYIRSFNSTYSDIGLKQSKKWPIGTLCITIAANIGKTAILEIEACFPDSVVGFTPSDQTVAEYVQFWMSRIQSRLEEIAPQSAQKNINLAILRELPIPVPPRAQQDEFRATIFDIEAQKSNLIRSTDAAGNLFTSLQHRAFRGEL